MKTSLRLKEALACVRKANTAVEETLRNDPLLLPEQRSAELRRVRVELSVAAGHLAWAIEETEAQP